MALKKSDLYSSIWASCDELRGGMDAGQYKDYVLFMLFIKYISDKYADYDGFEPPIVIPKGASFKDMVALTGDPDIGNKINTQIIQPLIDANTRLARADFPDFNDPNKLGDGQTRVERLGNLIAIFSNPALDFAANRAEHDDILGDAYEYLMRHFATQSGKSKGQFYTPSEVSRVIAKVIGISPQNTVAATTAYDPTCGSGSLLLKVAAESGKHITLEGQEKDSTTAGLARMNMILHDFPTANIASGGEGTLVKPRFLDGEQLRTYDYVVANPPFSDKTWSTGLTLGESGEGDRHKRFTWGVPPKKQGDYAYLLHIIRSMKSTGKAACILPHGVLFRGNAEADTSNGSVQVMLFSDRLEVWNPGRLPPSLSLANLREPHASVPGNPLVAESMYLAGYIERMGTGTQDMIVRCREAGLREPEFAVRDGFVTTIRRMVAAAGSAPPESRPESQPESQPESLELRVLGLLRGGALSKARITTFGEDAICYR
jgi:type I restriction enzyme M protein